MRHGQGRQASQSPWALGVAPFNQAEGRIDRWIEMKGQWGAPWGGLISRRGPLSSRRARVNHSIDSIDRSIDRQTVTDLQGIHGVEGWFDGRYTAPVRDHKKTLAKHLESMDSFHPRGPRGLQSR